MGIQIGDMVFNSKGKPGIVSEKDEITGKLRVNTEGDSFEKSRKRGYFNGLSQPQKEIFNQVIDRIRGEKMPEERLAVLTSEISKLKHNPQNQTVVNYLEGEKAHIMHTEGIHSRTFHTTEQKLR